MTTRKVNRSCREIEEYQVRDLGHYDVHPQDRAPTRQQVESLGEVASLG